MRRDRQQLSAAAPQPAGIDVSAVHPAHVVMHSLSLIENLAPIISKRGGSSISGPASVPIGDTVRESRSGPLESQPAQEVDNGENLDIIACQLQRALAADRLLSVIGEGGEPVDPLEHRQVDASRLDAHEAAEGLVVLR